MMIFSYVFFWKLYRLVLHLLYNLSQIDFV